MAKKPDEKKPEPSGKGAAKPAQTGKPAPKKPWVKTKDAREDGDQARPARILGVPVDGEDRTA
jgi:hypothetical protein